MPDVTYRFTSIGADSVARQFESISTAARRTRSSVRSSTKESVQAVKDESRQVAAATRARNSSSTQAARTEERNRAYVGRIRDRHFAAMQRQEEQQTRIVERETSKRQKAEERATKRTVTKQNQVTERQNQAREDMQGAMRERRDSMVMGAASAVASKTAALVGDAIKDRMQLTDSARRLSIQGRAAGTEGVDPAELVRDAEKAAAGTRGTKASDIIAAQSKFVEMTGDLDTARKMGSTFAVAASASGGSTEDIAGVAATFSQKFGIKDETGMQAALATMNFQGKAGAFEQKDAASYYQAMGAAGARFGLGQGADAVNTLGGLSQGARGATGTGAQASTAVQGMFDDLITHSGRIKKMNHGKDIVFKDKGHTQTNNIKDIIAETIGAANGDLTKLSGGKGGIFGKTGMRAVSPYITAYNDAAHATTGNAAAKRAAGEAAVMKALNDSINVTSSWSEVVKDSAAAQKSSTSIAISAWEKFAGTIGAAVEPALMTLGTDLSIVTMATKPVAESLADLVDTFTQVSTAIQSLPGFAGPEMDAAQKGKNDKELADLDALGKRGPLSARQTLRKHMLEDQNIEISQKLPQSEPGMVHPNYAKQSEMAAADLKNNVNGGSIWDHIKSAASVGFGTSNGSVASSVLTGGGAGAVRSLGTLAKSYNDAKESGALTAAANKLSAAADKLAVIGNPIGSVHDWILK